MSSGDVPVNGTASAHDPAGGLNGHRSSPTEVFIATLRSLRPDPVLRARIDRLEADLDHSRPLRHSPRHG